jgi:signal transduction histidine kinase
LLKEFTENTSHELQTPLAIIKSQIELLIQADNLTEAQYKNLSKSISAINKLSKLNEALGLLAKIENSQFQATESLDLTSLIESKLSNCEHLLEIKSIEVKKKMDSSFKVEMNSLLADILIENLINNSIKHNVQNGKINIEVNTREIKIFNTGIPLSYPTSELFQRFTKSNSQSLGLGLSIVKEICSQNNIKINYEYEDNWHKVTLLFG